MQKSFKEISWQVDEPTYRADKAYSYSTLSRFNREGFEKLDTLFESVATPSLTFGSMVDTMLTDGMEAFNLRFEVSALPEMSENLVQIARTLFDRYHDEYHSISDIPDMILAAVGKECNYYAGDKYASYRTKLIKENCAEYYNVLFRSLGKELVSQADYDKACACVDALRTSPMTSWYFETDSPFEEIERLYQLKFKGEYEGIQVRCMSDLLVVDHKNKIVYPCDLKTSSHREYEFPKSFIQWRYVMQAQLYWYIIRQNMDKDPVFKDYKLADYRFIVVNNKDKFLPLVWEFDQTQSITDFTYGKRGQYSIPNWRKVVKELDYYLTEKPEYPKYVTKLNSITDYLNNE